MSAENPNVMNDTEKDVKVVEELCIKKEDEDPNDKWLDIKEESVEYSAQAVAASEYQFSPLLLLPPKQEPSDGSIPHSPSKTSVSKGPISDSQVQGEPVEYNTSCDTTGMHQLTSQLAPIAEVFIEDLSDSEEERTSTYEEETTCKMDGKMLVENINTEDFIQEVEKHRAVLDSSTNQHNNRNEKRKVWSEIINHFIPDFEEKSLAEKKEIATHVVKKFKGSSSILQENQQSSDETNEDKLFLLSLLSKLQKIPAGKKPEIKSFIRTAIAQAQQGHQKMS